MRVFSRLSSFTLLFVVLSLSARAQPTGEPLEILVTSGLNGRFDLMANGPARLEQLALTIANMRKNKPGIYYFDLGNSFFPGALSRFSLGLAMADFFKATRVNGINIASGDLQLGIDTMVLLQKTQNIPLLSASIVQKKKYVFTPGVSPPGDPAKPAFIALPGPNLPLRVAEQEGRHFTQLNPVESITRALNDLPPQAPAIVLSGQPLEINMKLLKSFAQIKLVISNQVGFGGTRLQRVQLQDGRSVVMLGQGMGVTSIRFNLAESKIEAIEKVPLLVEKSETDFTRRVALWRKRFADEDRLVLHWKNGTPSLTEEKVGSYLRSLFDCEVAVLEKHSIVTKPFQNQIYQSDILQRVNDDFNIARLKLTGAQLNSLPATSLVIDGIVDQKIQGYGVKSNESYSVCTTEKVLGQYLAEQVADSKSDFESMWLSIPQLLEKDLYQVLSGSFHPEHRLRQKLNFKLGAMIESSQVNQGDSIDTPPGKPSVSALRYRLEGRLDYTVYNQYHHLLLSPYVLIGRQIDQPKTGRKPTFAQTIRDNLMTYTLEYHYNPQWLLKPYHRSYLEAAVFKVNNQRPALVRETLGLRLPARYLNLNTGLGFEKSIQDPVEVPVWGLEVLLFFRYPVFKNLYYQLDLNTFASAASLDSGQAKLRSELSNALEFKIDDVLSFIIKQSWFYFFQKNIDEKYDNFRIMSGLTYRLDLKS